MVIRIEFMDDLVKLKCDYFDAIIKKILETHLGRLGDYNCIPEFPDYDCFNIVIGGTLYEYVYEIDVDSCPLSLYRTKENKYNIDIKQSGIYYKGFKVSDL